MELTEGNYQINGIKALDLCEKYGTPLYVYDSSIIMNQYMKISNAFSKTEIKINYACKALTNLSILKLFKKIGAGLDTVSIQEVWLGLKAGFEPKDIIFTPNCVSMKEYKLAVEAGVRINIDNISILEEFGHEFGDKYPVCIRINPHIMAGGNSKISVGHIDSKFGISIHQLPLVQRIVKANNTVVEGLHMHTGSDILDTDVFLQGAEILFDIANLFDSLCYIDFGSGFKVAYKPDDIETDIDSLAEALTQRFNDYCIQSGKKLTLMFEPGKFLVSEAGFFLVNVNVVKQTTSTVFAGVDSGMNHLIRPMFYDSYHEIINLSNPEGKPRIYTVVGYICETDTFGYNRKIREISEGDVLAFRNAGAYCYSMSSNYNSRFRPSEILLHNGKDYLIRERECLDDLVRNQKEINF